MVAIYQLEKKKIPVGYVKLWTTEYTYKKFFGLISAGPPVRHWEWLAIYNSNSEPNLFSKTIDTTWMICGIVPTMLGLKRKVAVLRCTTRLMKRIDLEMMKREK